MNEAVKCLKNVLSVAAILTTASRAYGALLSEGESIAGRQSFVINGPAGGPTGAMAGGPLMGNGDVGVMLSGPAEELVFYIGKNDSWGRLSQSVLAVGQMRIMTPALGGASLKTTVDMQHAELRGDYVKGNTALASRSWVDANRNLLCVELANTGTVPLVMTLKNGTSGLLPPSVKDTGVPILLGCEQLGAGRWFFSGEMADITVLDRALSEAEIAQLAQGKRGEVKTFDGNTRLPLTAPAISKALTISGWVKVARRSTDADYIMSKGEWNQGYSFGLSNGRLRFSIGGFYLQCDDQIPLDQWIHVAGIFDDKHMAVLMGGIVKKSILSVASSGSAVLYDLDAPNPGPDSRKIAVATRILGNADAGMLTLDPGKTAVIVAAILSDLDCKGKDPLAEAQSLTAALTAGKIAEYGILHRQWWQAFWNKSFIEIPDKVLEQHWYAAQYIMASCSRAGKVAPGLWGNWVTTDKPGWHGDFHLNYNFQAPYFGVYAANHADVSLPLYQAINEFVPRGKKIAEKKGWRGVHFPVSIGPWGMCPEGDDSDWGQRSNAAYAALNFIWHYQYTQDKEWLKNSGYTFLREVADFWEDYLKFENGRYIIYNDSMHEGSGPDMNNLLSLGLVGTLFKNMLVMSADLGVDENRRAKWQDICGKLSAFPTQERNGKTVFRYAEKGMAWCNDNTLGIQHIFPAGAISLDSDPKLLEIARNMIQAMGRWSDGNGFATWYTACARVGHDPKAILAGLRTECDKRSMSNRLLSYGGGGIENCAGFNAINEMLLQSQVEKSDSRSQKSEVKNGESQVSFVIRLFPCWPKETDAKFGTLRTVGAFLVSAGMKNGIVSGVKIVSEKGRDCTVVNPWLGTAVAVTRNGKKAETLTGERLLMRTGVGEILGLLPDGDQ
ncbi:MAG: LamG-like jellyroll fold domain-containing protein [bacterium]